VKLVITKDSHQYILNKTRRSKGEEVLIPLGYYATVRGLAHGVAEKHLHSKCKSWTPEQLIEALATFKAEAVKLESRCTSNS
jgi:hypothetical protein